MNFKSCAYLKSALALSVMLSSPTLFAERPTEARKAPEVEGAKKGPRTESPEEAQRRRAEEQRKVEEQRRRSQKPGQSGNVTEGAASSSAKPEVKDHSKIEDRKSGLETPRGSSKRFGSKEAPSELDITALKALTDKVIKNEALKLSVMKEQEAQFKEYEKDPNALKGFFEREGAFLKAIGENKEMGEEEAKAYENAILKRLKGDSEEKVTKEDLEELAALSCANQCGHEGMGKACRRTRKFLDAAKLAALSPVAFAAAWKLYSGWGANPKDAVKESSAKEGNLSIEYEPGKKLVIEKIDEPVVDEKRAPKES